VQNELGADNGKTDEKHSGIEKIMKETHEIDNPDSGAQDTVQRWLEERPQVNGFYSLSPDRPFAHDENDYDGQYAIADDDLGWGSGLLNLLRWRGADMSSPCMEIGCGTGALTLGLAVAEEYPFVLATDMSSAFLRIVESKARSLSITPDRLRLAVYDSDASETHHPPGGVFSLIALRAVLHHVVEPGTFIQKMAALLKPSGFLVMHEPCRDGMVFMGLLARIFELSLIRASVRQQLGGKSHKWKKKMASAHNISRCMKTYARRDIDKSAMEDKHVFQPEEIMRWGQDAGLDTEFLPNLEFFQFSNPECPPAAFSVRHYISSYLRYCMSLDEDIVKEIVDGSAPFIQYVEQCSLGGSAPAFHGIFVTAHRV
jgi:2-polyprenyl-3-methyl-5-hydroxy-6-metoxy-1,4-benzoquinol methylase